MRNSMDRFHFRIADISIQMDISFPVEMTENYAPFLTVPSEIPSEELTVSLADIFPGMPEPQHWCKGNGETILDGRKVCLHRLGTHPPYLMEIIQSPTRRDFFYRTAANEQPNTITKVFNNLGFEDLLFRHEALILHCSLVRWQGKGILFSAPSGTGKSTQADLWEKYQGSETLNGDRAGLRKIDGVWSAFGLPFAGSSGIFRNESAPISVIVLLEQGPDNQIFPMTPAQAIRKLFPEITLHHWDPIFMEQAMNLILDLISSVPVYRLVCRPDQEAVDLLHETITEEV